MSNFYMILTDVGIAKIANSQLTNQTIDLTQIAVGDGDGAYYNPVQTATALKNETWRGNISSVSIDPNNANWIVVEGIIPSTVGGFTIREVGLFDSNNEMIAIGKVPETYKPTFEEGSSKDLHLKSILEVSNADAVTMKADPSVIIASKKYVDDKISIVTTNLTSVQQQVNKHIADNVKHLNYSIASGTNSYTASIQGIDSLGEGVSVKIKFTNENTGPCTLNINGLGAMPIRKANGNELLSGNIKAGQIMHLVYTGTVFQLLGEGGEYGTAGAPQVLEGYTVGREDGVIDGTMPNRGSVTSTINAGNSYTIPEGYHNGSGKVTANSLASQTLADATAANILYGKTAWVNGQKITGTIPSKAAATITPGTTNQTIAANQFLSGVQTILGDPDLIAPNIISGKNIFGVAGTARELKLSVGNVVHHNVIERVQTASTTSYVQISEPWKVNYGGMMRVSFNAWRPFNGTGNAYIRIYKNGVAYGKEWLTNYTLTDGGFYISYVEDLAVNAGDIFAFYGKGTMQTSATPDWMPMARSGKVMIEENKFIEPV
ncbi:phage tail protein [Lysinibacillus telephonicus]|uniref:phage tail protein n=1 Tax=Lysinibacillus telephonicus TaxID=1714840 RepID=UPI003BA057AB